MLTRDELGGPLWYNWWWLLVVVVEVEVKLRWMR